MRWISKKKLLYGNGPSVVFDDINARYAQLEPTAQQCLKEIAANVDLGVVIVRHGWRLM